MNKGNMHAILLREYLNDREDAELEAADRIELYDDDCLDWDYLLSSLSDVADFLDEEPEDDYYDDYYDYYEDDYYADEEDPHDDGCEPLDDAWLDDLLEAETTLPTETPAEHYERLWREAGY